MDNPKARKNKQQQQGFYWESDSESYVQSFIEIQPIKITSVNEFYCKKQTAKTRQLIGELFLQRNVPRFIDYQGNVHLVIDRIYDPSQEATLHLWARLCEYPPTHCLTVGYLAKKRRVESVKLMLSLRPVGERTPWAVQWIGMVIARFLRESKTGYFLTPRKDNAEFWLQCVFAVVCDIRES